ncbi:hypothetical protein O6H91_07G032100 [Diphasiastrum complanatum]|nr:hypothetical protein O6H91_07G032100 [Diphasiastrum complanatum]
MLEELTPNFEGDSPHQQMYYTASGMVPGSTSTVESTVSPVINQHLQQGAAPCTTIAGEFPYEAHLGAHRSDFRHKSLGGIFGNIYSAEQLGLNQEVSTKQGSHRLMAISRELHPEKHNIRTVCGYSGSVNEKPFHVSGGSELFYNSNEFNQNSVQQPQRPMGPVSQQAAIILDSADSAQESGLRLVHLLLACAESIHRDDLVAAEKIVREIPVVAEPHNGPMKRVATQFVDALARRIYGIDSQDTIGNQRDSVSELLHFHFYETCPFLKFAHFTANQAILEAFENHRQVHVIDFNLMHGLQWPALIQALALRPGGPPFLRITGIGPPQPGGNDVLQEIGLKLAQLAKSVNVEFDFRGVVASKLDDVKPWMLQVSQGEAVAVNSISQLHRLVYAEDPVVSPPLVEVLQTVRSLNPRIVTIVEQEANHNSPIFLERFMEALHYYSTMFDSFEACSLDQQGLELMLAETYLGREICNIIACEGLDRVERHETLDMWRIRMCNAGFQPVHLGSNAFKQARMLLTLFSGEGYIVEENGGCLSLGWQSRPLIAASAWQSR